MTHPLTLLCVHAHPDDESSSTGGILRIAADEGIRTVLVTCTDGALGDAPDGTKPEDEHHDPTMVAQHRAKELQQAAAILGIARVEMLGFPDSGMEGWSQNEATNNFWSTPVDEAAARLVPILLDEQPQVVVTYDEIGFYGHPDHIQAHRVTKAALVASGLTSSLLYPAIPISAFQRFREVLAEAGVDPPGSDDDDDDEGRGPPGTPDEKIGVVIDVSSAVDAKFDALAAHASQTESSFFLKMGRERFREFFRTEWFVRAIDPLGRTGIDHDLFAGWR